MTIHTTIHFAKTLKPTVMSIQLAYCCYNCTLGRSICVFLPFRYFSTLRHLSCPADHVRYRVENDIVEVVGQVYNQMNELVYLGGNVNHNANMSIQVNRRMHAQRMVQLPEV